MGYMFVIGNCICGAMMTFNPNTVPSVRIDGVRHAVCRVCIKRANPRRIENGLDPVVIAADAYEAADAVDSLSVVTGRSLVSN